MLKFAQKGIFMILSTKQIKENSGRKAQQDGEKVKNLLSNELSYSSGGTPSASLIALSNFLNIKMEDIKSVNTKAHSDGRVKCAKSDLRVSILNSLDLASPHQISLKSTFSKTQVAVHSVNSFEIHLKNLKNKKIILPNDVKYFLTYFSNSKVLPNGPKAEHDESKRRERFSVDEINNFNKNLLEEAVKFFKGNAKQILFFLISQGSEVNQSNFANLLAFCDKKLNNLIFVDIGKLIGVAVKNSEKNNYFCVPNKPRKNAGITTISLYDGLITLQMKGSGKGAAYHNLQFNISGNFIKKWIKQGLI